MQIIKDRFSRETDSLFVEAKRATVVSRPVIPQWFIILTIALGWNELMAILRNPLLTLLLAIILGLSYLTWYTNMTGPVLQIALAGATEFGRQTKSLLKEKGFDADEKITHIRHLWESIFGFCASIEQDNIEMESIENITDEDKQK